MKTSKSSRQWLAEHHSDPFVLKAREAGYRARSFFKLDELDRKYKILKPGMKVVDLGAAPGGWSQYAIKKVGRPGCLIALDILPMEPIPGVECLQGDFMDPAVLASLSQRLADQKVDVVLSDIAPNMSGIRAVDQARSMYLAELTFEFAKAHLKGKGAYVVKVFHGEGQQEFLAECRKWFTKVIIHKPEASRARSSEVYIYGQGFLSREN